MILDRMRMKYLHLILVTALMFTNSCSLNKEVAIELIGKPQTINMKQIVQDIKSYNGLKDTVIYAEKRYKYVLSPNREALNVRYDIYKSGTIRIGTEIPFDEDIAIQALKRKNVTYPSLEHALSSIIKGYSQLSIEPIVTINEYFELVKEEAAQAGAKDSIVSDNFTKIKNIALQKIRTSKDVIKLEYLIKHINYQQSFDKEKLLGEEGLISTKDLDGKDVLIVVEKYKHKNLDPVDNIEYAIKAAERALELKVELAGGKINVSRLGKYLLDYSLVNNTTSKVILLVEPNNIPILNALVAGAPARQNLFKKTL